MVLRRDRLLSQIELIYRRDGHVFLRVARGITGNPETAAEAVQQGFADALRGRETFRGDGPLEAWLWRAVVNAARKSLRGAEHELGAVDTLTASSGDAGIEASDEAGRVAPLISRLPPRQRLAIFLRYYADLDYRTIGAVLDIEVGTVSATLAVAHRTLRRELLEVSRHG